METLIIRQAVPADFPALRALFRDTVLRVNCRDYTREEVEDWAACAERVTPEAEPMRDQQVLVAETAAGLMEGFASVSAAGHLHMLFVHNAFQRRGVGTALYARAEALARQGGARVMTAEVSRTAKPFFERQGFRVDREQTRQARRLWLVNYAMSKRIGQAHPEA